MSKINILHCGDIHIRTVSRYKETKHVFDNLFAKLDELVQKGIWRPELDRIYVGGDIVHSKLQMSPECVDLLRYFFLGLARYAHVDVILGNHDCNLNNPDRLDAISPVVDALNNDKIHLYMKPELVEVPNSNIVYGVYSVLHGNEGPVFEKDPNKVYLALFHGCINNSLTDINFLLSGSHSLEKFEHYDYGLFADIHKRQFLDRNKRFAYSGSLFQNNYGESNQKGVLLWSFDTAGQRDDWSVSTEFIEVENDYQFHTLDLTNSLDLTKLPKLKNVSKFPSIRVLLGEADYNITEIKDLTNRLRVKYQPTELKIINNVPNQSVEADQLQQGSMEDVSSLTVQEGHLKDYFKDTLNKTEMKSLLKINREINDLIDTDHIAHNINWQVEKINFDNTFSYGEKNYIDFTNLQGVTGIFAPNASGKSSIFLTVLYALYNTTPYILRTEEVVNKLKNSCFVEVFLRVGSTRYRIQRGTAVPNMARKRGAKSHYERYSVRTSLDFAQEQDGEWVSLNGKQRTETEVNIRSVFGTYNDFLITSLSTQGQVERFLNLRETDRIEYLMKFLGLDIYNEMHKHAKDQVSEVRSLLASYKRQDFSEHILKLTKREAEQISTIEQQTVLKKEADKNNRQYYKRIVKLASQVVETDDDLDLSSIDYELTALDNKIQDQEETSIAMTSILNNLKKEVSGFNDTILREELDQERDKLIKFKKLNSKTNEVSHNLELINQEISKDKEMIVVLEEHEYDPNCKYCISCNFVKEAIDVKVKLKDKSTQQAALQESLQETQAKASLSGNTVSRIADLDTQLTTLSDYKAKIDTGKLKLENIRSQISVLKTQKEDWTEKRRLYFRQEEQIRRNKEVRAEIAQLEKEKLEWQEKEADASEKILTAEVEIRNIKESLTEIQKTMKEFKSLEKKVKLYNHYIEAVHRTGIPYLIVQKNLSYVNQEINKILSSTVDFKVSIEVGEQSKSLPIFLYYADKDRRRIDTGSGMEKLLSSIAIRAALVKISSLPKCNVFAIDEGFGSLDADNLNEMKGLFEYLKTLFDHVLIITHIEAMQDVCNNIINVEKKNGFSRVRII